MKKVLSAAILVTATALGATASYALPLQSNQTDEQRQYHEWYDTNANKFHNATRSNSDAMNWERRGRQGDPRIAPQNIQTPGYPATDHRP